MGPTNNHPGQAAYAAVAGRATLSLAVVAAVGGGPEDSDWLAAGSQYRVNFEHIGDVVCCIRVVGPMHSQGDRVVVHRDIWLPVCPGNAGARTTAAGEQIHHQFFLEGQAHAWLAMDELGFLLLCGHKGSSPGIFAGQTSRWWKGMLNDHGKKLVKAWLSVPAVVIVLAVIFCSALAIRRFDLNSSEIASWVQAFGSIAAIWFALLLGRRQIESQDLSNKKNAEMKADAFLAVFEGAAESTDKISSLAAKGVRVSGFLVVWDIILEDVFKANLNALKNIPVHELGRRELVIGHARMLSYMLQIEQIISELVEAASDNKNVQVRWAEMKYKNIVDCNNDFHAAIVSYRKVRERLGHFGIKGG